jgi:hypothetical protein
LDFGHSDLFRISDFALRIYSLAMSQPDILRYQRDRSLADAPGFSVGLQLRLPDNTKVYLALGPAEFTLTFRDANLAP